MKKLQDIIIEKLRLRNNARSTTDKGIFIMTHQYPYQIENAKTFIFNNDLDSDMTDEYDYYKLSSSDTFIQISSVGDDLGEDDMQTAYDLKTLRNLQDILKTNKYELVYILTDILQLWKKPFKKEIENIVNMFNDTKFNIVNIPGELDLRAVHRDFHFNDNVTLYNYLDY